MFEIGDRVEWTSQSAGTTKAKAGTVVEVLPPETPLDLRKYRSRGYSTQAIGFGARRSHRSYLIRVEMGPTRKPRLYWPRVAHLRKQEEKTAHDHE